MIAIMNNIENIQDKCKGCGACEIICPTNAIVLEINSDGYYSAKVNGNKCINCGKCLSVCIKKEKLYDEAKNLKLGKLLAAQSNNESTLKSCTSGGIAHEIAKKKLLEGYIIAGTVYDYEQNIAKVAIIENEKDLNKLKGSKYIQSLTNPGLNELIEKARKGNKIVYFGTPCQIAGAYKVLQIMNLLEEVIFIDLFCHGVPSYLVWEQYLRVLKNDKKIDHFSKINFRSKFQGWHDFTMEIHGEEKEYYKSSESDLFYKIFFDNILLNPSCFHCQLRKQESFADIRLGDFWGKDYQDNDKGVSAVLILTERGKKLIDQLSDDIIKIIRKHNVDDCLKYQSIHDYSMVSNNYIEMLKKDTDLTSIRKIYKKDFSFSRRIKLQLKESTAILPSNMRKKIRNVYRKWHS